MQSVIRRLLPLLIALAWAPGAEASGSGRKGGKGEAAGAETGKKPAITAAVAASAQFAMEAIRAEFRAREGVEVNAVYGSSGRLVAQIRSGAPFDVFVSADMEYPDSLAAWGLAAGTPRPYAFGRLVLWTARNAEVGRGMAALGEEGVSRIALAAPGTAPYGREAMKALRRAGLAERVRGKLIFGESVAQVTLYVLMGSVDVAVSAKSVVMAPEMAGKGTWAEVDSSLYDPIAQGAVVCRRGRERNPGPSARFLDFLASPPARAILSRHGYGLPPGPEVTRK